MTCLGVVDSGLRRNDGGEECLGCSFAGLLWGPVVGGLRGNASLPGPWLLVLLARFGRPFGLACQDATRQRGSAAPARPLQGRPPRVRHGCDTGRAGLLSPSPDGVGQSSSFTRRADGAPSGFGTSQDRYATSLSCGSSTSPPLGRAPTTERLLARGFGIIGADPEVTTRSRACQMGSTAFCDCMTMACQG